MRLNLPGFTVLVSSPRDIESHTDSTLHVARGEIAMDTEQIRLEEDKQKKASWKKWGPYLSERHWGPYGRTKVKAEMLGNISITTKPVSGGTADL
jgi:hypothetical protein